MGDLIDFPYRRVPRQVVDRLVRSGYLANANRWKTSLVVAAWECFKRDVDSIIAARNRPKQPS
jgi:hypothetical protein